MSAQREIDILHAIKGGDPVDLHKALERRDREVSMGTCYDPYEDLQDLQDPPTMRDRRAKIQDLEQQVQRLQARLQARDATIARLWAKIKSLQKAVAEKGMTPVG